MTGTRQSWIGVPFNLFMKCHVYGVVNMLLQMSDKGVRWLIFKGGGGGGGGGGGWV